MGLRNLDTKLQEKVKKSFDEDENKILTNIKEIKEWIGTQRHLSARIDDQWLLSFLRGCKYNLEKTKDTIDAHYSMRSVFPEFFKNRDPFSPLFQELLELGVFIPLPQEPLEPAYILCRIGIFDPNKIDLLEVLKLGLMFGDVIANENDAAAINGISVVVDMSGFEISHILVIETNLIKKIGVCLKRGYPFKPNKAIVVNGDDFEMFFNIYKHMIADKYHEKLAVCHNSEELFEQIPKSRIPEELGGVGGSIKNIIGEWKKKLESYSNWFKDDEKHGTEESERKGESKLLSDKDVDMFFSFKQLGID